MTSSKALIVIRVTAVLLVVFFSFFIFFMSGEEGEESTALSMQVSLFIIETLDSLHLITVPDGEAVAYASSIQFYVRKAAHITEFALLTFSIMAIYFSYRRLTLRTIVLSVLFAVLFAAADEYHQTFVPQRCGCVTDVCIDSIGIVGAAVVTYFLHRLRHKRCSQC